MIVYFGVKDRPTPLQPICNWLYEIFKNLYITV